MRPERGRRGSGECWPGELARDDRGSAAPLAAAVLALACAASFSVVASGAASAARQRVIGASDAAALAAADASAGLATGAPCDVAARVAAANRASLTACRVEGTTATVDVAAGVLGIRFTARSTAGQPEGGASGAGAR